MKNIKNFYKYNIYENCYYCDMNIKIFSTQNFLFDKRKFENFLKNFLR